MLSKIIVIIQSLLLVLITLSFSSKNSGLDLAGFFTPDFDKLNITSLPVIVMLALALVFMILGIMFSSIEASSRVNKLLNFIKKGMPDNELNKLDTISKNIAEYIKGLQNGGAENLSNEMNEQNQTDNQDEANTNETQEDEKGNDISETEDNQQAFQENDKENDKENDNAEEEYQPMIPNPSEFDDEGKKTIVADSFSLDQIKKNIEASNDEPLVPSANFSTFSDEEDEEEKGAETVIATVPEELLKESQEILEQSREQELKAVFKKYYEMKIELGESTASLTETAFIKKLKDTEKNLITTKKCKRVEFTVYNKNGKAALKATPKF